MSFGSLYNLTLQKESSSINSVLGSFLAGTKQQQIVISKATSIDLCTINADDGSLEILFQQELFTSIRSLTAIKISGVSKTLLAIVTSSGDFQIWGIPDNTTELKGFIRICNEPFGKSGFRRVSPGKFLVSDQKGRAIMLGAIEKNKLVYVLHKKKNEISDEEGNEYTNESTHSMGIEQISINSPLEANRSKILTIDLVSVDVGYDNPLFASIEIDYSKDDENNKYLTFYELDLGLNHVLKKSTTSIPKHSNMLVPIPGGDSGPSGVLLCMKNYIEYRSQNHKAKSHYLPIPQVRRISNINKDTYIISSVVHTIKNKKENTFIILLQSDHGDLFKISLHINNDLLTLKYMEISYFDTIPVSNQLLITKSGLLFLDSQFGNKQLYQIVGLGDADDEPNKIYNSNDFFNTSEDLDGINFKRHENAKNLELVDELEGINPVIKSKFLNNDEPNIKDDLSVISSSFVEEQSTLKQLKYGLSVDEIISTELPKDATDIFITKTNQDDDYDKYLVISFSNSTLVLSIGESIEEVSDSGFYLNGSTLCVEQMGNDLLIQAHSNGVVSIKDGKIVNKWFPPAGIKVIATSSTNTQLLVALSNKTIVYFELNDFEVLEEAYKFELQSTVISISLCDIAEGKFKSDIAAISCNNQTLHLFTTSEFELISSQELSSNTSSILLNIMDDKMYLHIGLSNGIYVRTSIGDKTYKISSKIVQYLGPSEVNIKKLDNGKILICGFNKTYVGFIEDYFKILPLTYNHHFKSGACFNSEDTANGLIGIHDQSLYIVSSTYNSKSNFVTKETINLKYSPKEFQHYNNNTYILQNDLSANQCTVQIFKGSSDNGDDEIKQHIIEEINLENCRGFNICKIFFKSKNKNYMVISLIDLSINKNFIYVYDILNDGKLEFLNKTGIQSPCLTLQEFLGRLLIGMDTTLRIYDLGQKQLLRKSETVLNLSNIVSVKSMGLRIYIADIRNSITLLEYDIVKELFSSPICTDIIAKHVSCFEIIDYDTVVGGDKFGNIWVVRYNGDKSFELLSHYFISDIPMNFHRLHNINQSLAYTCLQGKIGVLLPLLTRSEIKFFESLEQAILDSNSFVNSMNFSKFRGYYAPSKNVIDGDLIESFRGLTQSQKSKISLKLDKSVIDIEKRIAEIRMKVL